MITRSLCLVVLPGTALLGLGFSHANLPSRSPGSACPPAGETVAAAGQALAHGPRVASEPIALGTRLLDLDGDGTLDMLVHHADGALLVRRSVGPRRFQDVVQDLPHVVVADILCGDLDGDGRIDLYLVSPGADVALLGEGGGRFREATAELGLVESGPGLSAERRDVDGDGLDDVLVHNQGSDVLFWARADGRYEREERTLDGRSTPVATQPGGVLVDPLAPTEERPGSDQAPDATTTGNRRALSGSANLPTGTSGFVAAPQPTPTTLPIQGIGFDQRYVNDNMGEVGSADIVDGSLTGADVSTSSGNVTFSGATVTAQKGTFGAGSNASGVDSTVSGGVGNAASNAYATVSGGNTNSASGFASTVSGGEYNTASANYSTVSGGEFNTASATRSTVSGGGFNTASGHTSTVSGGLGNTASGFFSTVAGGDENATMGDYSFAAGRRAKANHEGAFVWGDSVFVDKTSSANDQFNIYAEGGTRVFAVGQTTPSMVVGPSGNVGVGTDAPDADFALDIEDFGAGVNWKGAIAAGAASGQKAVMGEHNGVATIGGHNGALNAWTNLSINPGGGNVGIGMAAPAFKLEVNGSAHRVDNSSTWTVTSDERLKKNIHDLEGALEALLALRGVTFEYKDPARGDGLRRGFIAQEVEKVLPEWVEEGEDGYKRLTVNGFEALAVEALREQQREIEALRSEIASFAVLQAEIETLKTSLAALAAR